MDTNTKLFDELEKELINGIALMPAGEDMISKLKYAYALMCYPDACNGDIEFRNKNGDSYLVTRDSIPKNFKEFAKENAYAVTFHARAGIPVDKAQKNGPQYLLAVIAPGYEIMFDMMSPYTDHVMLHMVTIPDKMRNRFINFIEKSMTRINELSPPEVKNPEVLINNAELKSTPHTLHRTIEDLEENFEYACHRSNFDFHCLRSIKCCSECPMLMKSAELLEEEALDEKTAEDLKAKIELTGLFKKNGKCSDCDGSMCKAEKKELVNYINYLWFEAYKA